MEAFDIVIIGAGPAGLGFARQMSGAGLRIALVEQLEENILAEPPEDGRDIALTHTSEQIMEDLGMWQHIPEEAMGVIREAKVVNGRSDYALHFDSIQSEKPYLGRIVPNHLIRKAAYLQVKDLADITLITGALVVEATTGRVVLEDGRELGASLVVAADSRFSGIRRKMGISAEMLDFGRVVIVCEMSHVLPHNDVATECFHYDQTLAILPMHGEVSSVVVTLSSEKADAAMAMPAQAFAADIQERFGGKLGKMELITDRVAYPLVGVFARQFVAPRFALVGDAAVGMHPVTAHGYNLGLSGAALLSEALRAALAEGQGIGDIAVLRRYERAHRKVARPLYLGTNALVKLYTDTRLPAKILRGVALRLGNALPPIKQRIVQQLTQISARG
ncbi:MAG: 5-demethoxyubiquinol-8 5-hydroxylase UbiM [Rhodobacteraceae bacterium]|nr:5-demethoxyubiquinol-8 5-hydroxylase UbiM [Paracoccaceae bacterium]